MAMQQVRQMHNLVKQMETAGMFELKDMVLEFGNTLVQQQQDVESRLEKLEGEKHGHQG